jgi:hypothetical protein
LQRRANHLLISIVGRISPRPGNGRGLFHLELFESDGSPHSRRSYIPISVH